MPLLASRQGMRRAERLRHRREFAAVYRHGKPYRNELLVVRTLRTGRPESRVGMTAGRVVGNAVTRNRVKRRLREAVRSMTLVGGRDIVINARARAAQADYWALRTAAGELLSRAGVVQGGEGPAAT